jgi:hypothetical protein
MKKLIWIRCYCVLGCSQNHFNVPPDDLQQGAVLGVAPIMFDTTSVIKIPEAGTDFALTELTVNRATMSQAEGQWQLLYGGPD